MALKMDRHMHQDRREMWTVNFSLKIVHFRQNRRFLVVRIILNTKSPHFFKHGPGRLVRIFLNNKSPHLFKHGPHFFKQVRIIFKHGPHFFKHGPHFFKHGPHFFKQEVRIFFKHKVRILVPARMWVHFVSVLDLTKILIIVKVYLYLRNYLSDISEN